MNKCQYCENSLAVSYITEINKYVCFSCLVKNAVENLRRKKNIQLKLMEEKKT